MTLSSAQIEDLFHRHRDELTRRLVAMVNSRDTAADLVQEAYLRLLGLVNQQTVEHPRALLHRIAANLAIDHLRKEKTRLSDVGGLDDFTDVSSQAPSPERELIGKQRFRGFLRSIENLPPRTREAFLLCRVYGYSYREIAVRMKISESGVEKLLMRALEYCCDALNPPAEAE